MSVSFCVPPADAVVDVRSATLAVSHSATGLHYQLRVDGGLAFVRGVDAPSLAAVESAAWHPASLESVLAAFAGNSPIASWLRAQGVDLMQVVLRNVATGELIEAE